MEILVKENDRLSSTIHKGRYVSEYLIYLLNDKIQVECYNEVGEKAKNDRVNELLMEHFITTDSNGDELKLNNIIKEISFEEFKQQTHGN